MVVDAVIRHWVMVVAATKAVVGGLGATIQDLTAYFYVGGGIVASTQPERLQGVFNVLTDLSDRVGFRSNTRKTVSMACQPFHAPAIMSVVADDIQEMGRGPAYQERQMMRVQCL